MFYEIIFYHSGRTAELQNIISEGLSPLSLKLRGGCAAADAKEYSDSLAAAGKRRKLIFTVGGSEEGSDSPQGIIKRVLTPKKGTLKEEKLIIDKVQGVLMTVGDQTIILLPDDTEKVRLLMPTIQKRLSELYDIKLETDDPPDMDTVIKELDTQMAGTNRVKVAPSGSTAEKTKAASLKKLKITIAVLLILAAVQLGAASYLFITHL